MHQVAGSQAKLVFTQPGQSSAAQASLSPPAQGNVIGAFVQRNCCFRGHGIRQQESLVTGTREVPCLPADFYIPKERAHQPGETSALLMGSGQGGSGRGAFGQRKRQNRNKVL